jgi:rhamnose transport system substrate-binding protein
VTRRRLRLLAALAVSALAVALVAGFTTGAGAAGKKQVTIVYIEQNTGNPYFDRLASGMKQAAQKLGFKLQVTGPATADAASQIPIIQAKTQQHVDGILIQVNDEKAENAVLEQAKSQGIHVAAVNSDQIASVRDFAVTPVDFGKIPMQELNVLGKLMHWQGQWAILSATTTAPFQKGWVQQVRQIIKTDKRFKNMQLVKVAYGNDEPQKSSTETSAVLSAYPNLKAIISPTTVGVAAAAQVLEQSGRAKKVALTGLGTPNLMRKYIKDGTTPIIQLWDPADQGFVSAWLMYKTITGKFKPHPGAKIAVPGHGIQTVGKTGVVIAAPKLTTFTKANVDKYHF